MEYLNFKINNFFTQFLLISSIIFLIYLYKINKINKLWILISLLFIITIDSKISFDKTPQITKQSPYEKFQSNTFLENSEIKDKIKKYRTLYYKYPSVYHYTNELWGVPNIFGYNVVDIFSYRYLYYENFDLLGYFNTKFIVTKELLELEKMFNFIDYNSNEVNVYKNNFFNELFYENNNGFINMNETDCLKYISEKLKNKDTDIKVCINNENIVKEFNDHLANQSKNIKSLKILENQDSKLKLSIESVGESFLVWNENFHKYWNLKINNEHQKLYKVNGTISGFKINSGNNIISLNYYQKDSNFLKYLFIISLLSNFILFLIISNKSIVGYFSRFKKRFYF